MPPIRRLLGREVSEEEYRAAVAAEPEPPALLCLDCADSGFRRAKREHVAPTQIARTVGDVWGGRRIEVDECLIHCDRCPPETQRARLLRGVMPPADIRAARFERFQAASEAQQRALTHAQRWASREGPAFLLLVGPVGVGKSHLAKAATVYRAEHGEPVVWQTSAGILDSIRATFERLTGEGAESDPARAMTLREWKTVPVLAIDDLGSERATDWTITAMEEIIFDRYEHQRPTLITSNLSLEDMADRHADPHGRIVDRLADNRTERRTIYVAIDDAEGYRVNGGAS